MESRALSSRECRPIINGKCVLVRCCNIFSVLYSFSLALSLSRSLLRLLFGWCLSVDGHPNYTLWGIAVGKRHKCAHTNITLGGRIIVPPPNRTEFISMFVDMGRCIINCECVNIDVFPVHEPKHYTLYTHQRNKQNITRSNYIFIISRCL